MKNVLSPKIKVLLAGVLLAGAGTVLTLAKEPEPSLQTLRETHVELMEPVPQQERTLLPQVNIPQGIVYDSRERWDIEALLEHDDAIFSAIENVNQRYAEAFPNYQPMSKDQINLIRAQLITESWHGLTDIVKQRNENPSLHRTPMQTPRAWQGDVGQLAHRDDYGLNELKQAGTLNARGALRALPSSFAEQYANITHTTAQQHSNITPKQSTEGLVTLIIANTLQVEPRLEVSGREEVVVKPGDNYWNLLKERKLINPHSQNPAQEVENIFSQYNPNQTMNLKVGKTINLPTHAQVTHILVNQTPLKEGMLRYNGGGDPNYLRKIEDNMF